MIDARAAVFATILVGIFIGPRSAFAEDSHAVVAKSLADSLEGKATLDGSKVTGVRQVSECMTEFDVAGGSVRADWASMDNFAAKIDGSYVVIPLQHDGKVSQVRMLDGKYANRVESSFTLLYLDCRKK